MNFDNIKVNLQYFLPKHILTRAVGLLARAKLGKATTLAIEQFAKIYNINLEEMEGDISNYQTFNDFFARPLKYNARPIDAETNSVVFPSDGRISQFGNLKDTFQLQAKGHYFTTEALLGSSKDAEYFKNGSFMTVYLSPQDYHRVHIPLKGKLIKMSHIPGELFSVNPLYVRNIPELYSRNERVVCLFETEIGKVAVVLVGAAIVRSISTAWSGTVAPAKSCKPTINDYSKQKFVYDKGEEIGRFFMGSTVICLFEKDKIIFNDSLASEQKVKIGEKMAQYTVAKAKVAARKSKK
ncbi:MAG: phosphatidylserine decarboxylase [Alphaproteobacteria bacterium]|nr:phosphatidylserine decarboxylase [Alphaproteobacteria bacterium]